MLSAIRSFIKHNVTAQTNDFTITPDDPKGKKVQDDLNKVKDHADKVSQDIDHIRDESKLKPPSLNNFTDKDLLVTGATAGAMVGGALGMADGLLSVATDSVNPNITQTSHDVVLPKMSGFTSEIVPDVEHRPVFNANGDVVGTRDNTKGYTHLFHAQLQNDKVGTYSTPSAAPQHTAKGSPVSEGLSGLVGGAAIGLVISGAIVAGRHLAGNQGPGIDPDARPIEGEGKVMAATTLGGAVLGAAAGTVAGLLEQSHAQAVHLAWQEPIVQPNQVLGQMPGTPTSFGAASYYQSVFDTYNEQNVPRNNVTADIPKMHHNLLLQNVPEMQDKTADVAVAPRFSVVGEAIGGALVGGVMGAATGVAVNVLRRVL